MSDGPRLLLPQQPITNTGQMPSQDMVEIIQRLVRSHEALTAVIDGLTARVVALEEAMANINTIDDIDGGTA